jgi:hypothetical protein
VGKLFEDPLPAVVEVENPGAESPAWATGEMSEAVSPATTGSDTTTEGVRGSLKMIADGVVGGKMIMSARLISAGPRPGYTPILHESLRPQGPSRLDASRICSSPSVPKKSVSPRQPDRGRSCRELLENFRNG